MSAMDTLTAQDVMTPHVRAVRSDWTPERLGAFFTEQGISGAPVVSERGTLIGVVSVTDLARWNGSNEERVSRQQTVPQATVRDLMMPTVFCVEEDTPVREVVDKMIRSQLHRLFVTETGHRRRLVGTISALDLLCLVRDAPRAAHSSDTSSARVPSPPPSK